MFCDLHYSKTSSSPYAIERRGGPSRFYKPLRCKGRIALGQEGYLSKGKSELFGRF